MEVGQQLSFNAAAAVSLLVQMIEYERQQPTAITNGRKAIPEQLSHDLHTYTYKTTKIILMLRSHPHSAYLYTI
jgi:hypothetical protein